MGTFLQARLRWVARRADPRELNRVVRDPEAEPSGVRKLQIVEIGILEVEQLVAPEADQVVVPLGCRVETDGAARVGDFGDDAEIDQQIENPIHGHQRHARESFPDFLVDPLGGGVVFSIRYGFKDSPSLMGQGDTALSAGLRQLPNLLIAGGR